MESSFESVQNSEEVLRVLVEKTGRVAEGLDTQRSFEDRFIRYVEVHFITGKISWKKGN